MKTLKEKIAKAIAPRMETIDYGSRKGKLEEKTSGYIRVTPEELNFLVRMRMVSNISVNTDIGAYVGDTDSLFRPFIDVSITKKTAKKIASDFASSAKNYEGRKDVNEPIMSRVYIYKTNDINFNTKLMITLS